MNITRTLGLRSQVYNIHIVGPQEAIFSWSDGKTLNGIYTLLKYISMKRASNGGLEACPKEIYSL